MSNRTKNAKTDQLKAAVGKANTSQHITKISAKPSRPDTAAHPQDANVKEELIVTETGKTEALPVDKADAELNKPKKLSRKERKALKKSQKSDEERPVKSYFVLARPFVAFGRYLRDSWREIRQVRWPNRKATWKMTLAVLVYVALFMVFLTLLDVFFTFIFDLLFK